MVRHGTGSPAARIQGGLYAPAVNVLITIAFIQQADLNGHPLFFAGEISYFCLEVQQAGPIITLQPGTDGKVSEVHSGHRVKENVSFNAGQSQHILAFQVAGIAEPEDLHCNAVPAWSEGRGDIEFCRRF